MRLTVASYNIHRCVGTDRQHDTERVCEVLHELGADVIALQELERHDTRSPELLRRFAESTGLHAVAGPTVRKPEGDYGNALLIPAPPESVRLIDLTIGRREPRGAILADFIWKGLRMRVVATHLGLLPKERRHQTKQLLSLFVPSHEGPDVSILLGDLNEWYLWGRPLRWLHRHFATTPGPATFPAWAPFLSLDRIWVKPRIALSSVAAWKSATARKASDHLPLRAELDLTPLTGGDRLTT